MWQFIVEELFLTLILGTRVGRVILLMAVLGGIAYLVWGL